MVSRKGRKSVKSIGFRKTLYFSTFYFDEAIIPNKVIFDELACLFVFASSSTNFFFEKSYEKPSLLLKQKVKNKKGFGGVKGCLVWVIK